MAEQTKTQAATGTKSDTKPQKEPKAPKEPKVKKPRPTTIPEIKDKDGKLLKLKRSQFPATKEGKVAFFNYMATRYTEMAQNVAKGEDPATKKQAKIEKLQKQLELLQKEVNEAKAAKAAKEPAKK